MILKQYYLACLSHASYLVGDERTHTAAIVDPQRDVDQYLTDAAERGLAIRHVFLTHFHADFVAGHIEIAERTGATIHLGARAQAEFAFEPMRDGEALTVGDVRLAFLETPGHTPEGVSIVVYDLAKDARKPHAVLTGDTLFIGDVGRPDLMASSGMSAEELAGLMYDSLHGKLLKLSDDTLVYPAHGAGSACGKNLSKDTVSTIGAQRAHNYALQPMSKVAFVKMATTALPAAPAYFAHDSTMNRQKRPTLDDSLEEALEPLSLDEVRRLQRGGTLVL
jgi:glyoxylase-like metal-dependent hydrolase (beta-lactamase superfamily II)